MTACCPDRRFGVERVEDRLDQQHVDAAFDQPGDLLPVCLGDLTERTGPIGGIFDARRQRQGDVGRTDRTGDEPRATVSLRCLDGGGTGEAGCGGVDLVDQLGLIEPVLALGDDGRRERVGGDDVGARQQVPEMEVADGIGLGEHQQVEVAGQRRRVIGEPVAAQFGLGQPERLELAAAGAVEHQDPISGSGLDWVGRHREASCSIRDPSRSQTASASPDRFNV